MIHGITTLPTGNEGRKQELTSTEMQWWETPTTRERAVWGTITANVISAAGVPETIQLGNNKQQFEVLAGGKARLRIHPQSMNFIQKQYGGQRWAISLPLGGGTQSQQQTAGRNAAVSLQEKRNTTSLRGGHSPDVSKTILVTTVIISFGYFFKGKEC